MRVFSVVMCVILLGCAYSPANAQESESTDLDDVLSYLHWQGEDYWLTNTVDTETGDYQVIIVLVDGAAVVIRAYQFNSDGEAIGFLPSGGLFGDLIRDHNLSIEPSCQFDFTCFGGPDSTFGGP